MALRPDAGHGLLILEVSGSHATTHHSRQDFSGRVISSSQRPLPDNTQHLQQTNIHAPSGIRTHDLSRRAAQIYALDRAVTRTGTIDSYSTKNRIMQTISQLMKHWTGLGAEFIPHFDLRCTLAGPGM